MRCKSMRKRCAMELWGRCRLCERWFYVPSDTIEEMSNSRCPVCDAVANRFEDRGGAASFECTLPGVAQ